jgi:tRNA pseudouridine38-40 synthase
MRIALGLTYDGSAWQGWQTQPHRQTVQDTLEFALERFVGQPVPTICAGRTDAGVHAAMQVVHLDSPVARLPQSWVRGLNAHLPPTVAIRWAAETDPDFHARYAALSRTYVYALFNDPVRSPLKEGRAGWFHRRLDGDAMRQAAAQLLGEHDFSAFRAAQCQAATPVRTMHRLDILPRGRMVYFVLQANAFLHHMVRNIVGSLVTVGKGDQPPTWVAEVLASRNRALAAPTFSPAGLYLAAVEYPSRFGLPAADATDEILQDV